jgi:SAM-dependent methyltransferase
LKERRTRLLFGFSKWYSIQLDRRQDNLKNSTAIQSLYDSVAARWPRGLRALRDDFIGTPVATRIARKFAQNGTIVDCGCGNGNVCRSLSRFANHVIGVDISKKMLDEARSGWTSDKITYVQGRLDRLADVLKPESADLCLALFSVCCMKDRPELHRTFLNMYKILKPKKHAIIQIPHPADSFFRERSLWYKDIDRDATYFDRGAVVRRKLRTTGGEWLLVARHHFPLADYFLALTSAGFIVKCLLEPVPSRQTIRRWPTLSREARFPSSVIFICQRDGRQASRRRKYG